MDHLPYTLGRWTVKAGHEDAFVEAWTALSTHFLSLPAPPLPGTLVRNVHEPSLFYSFGQWQSLDDIAAMRMHPDTPSAIARVAEHCDEAVPGAYEVVARVG